MKRNLSLLLTACLLFAIGAASLPFAAGKAEQGNAVALSLYPAYLQTPLDMPVLLDVETYPAGQRLIWSSSNPSVAAVDTEGCVIPVSPGEAVITCALADRPAVTAACGVLVVAEGNILLWEYPPESIDMDAIIAALEVEEAANPPEAPNVSWPDNWPDDLPKMDGKVTSASGDIAEPTYGLYVMLTIPDVGIVKAYANELVSLGLKGNLMEYDSGFFAQLSGKGYSEIMITYTASEQQCFVSVKE